MRFSINRSELQDAITVVQKGVSTRSTLPVLSGILIEAKQDLLILQSTDLEVSIQYSVSALVEEEGSAVVPGKLFFDIIKSLEDAAVHFESLEGEARITCDTSSFMVKTLNPEDFPGFPVVQKQQSITVPFADFTTMVKRVARVVSRDESRAILTGILIVVEEGLFKMVATDSYRLALTSIPLPSPDVEDLQAVISGTFMNEVASLTKREEEITLSLAENQIVIEYGNTIFINRRIEGNYPNYKQLLPDSYESRAVLDVSALIGSVKRAALLSTANAPMRFDLNKDSQTMQISVSSPDVGSVQETLVCEIEGEDVQIAFNSSYVTDGLSVIKGEQVDLEVQSSLKPGIFRTHEPEDYLYLIMPVRI